MATYQSKFSGSEIDAGIDAANAALPKSGGTMTGALILHSAPSANNGAATKKYVDDAINEIELTPGENGATFTPTVSSGGVLSWSNDKNLSNPASVNIKGPAGADGADGVSPTITTSEITGGHRLTITDATGTKTVDIMDGADGTGGGGGSGVAVQADWNQNDPEQPDYIKNRPFYEGGEGDVIAEGATDGGALEAIASKLMEEGGTYYLTADGTTYTATAKVLTELGGETAPEGTMYIGNLALIGVEGVENTGEMYFALTMYTEGMNVCMAMALNPDTGEPCASIKITGAAVVKIPARFLPDMSSSSGITILNPVGKMGDVLPYFNAAEFDAAMQKVINGAGIVYIDGLQVMSAKASDSGGYYVYFAGAVNQTVRYNQGELSEGVTVYYSLSAVDKTGKAPLKLYGNDIVNEDNEFTGTLSFNLNDGIITMTQGSGDAAVNYTFIAESLNNLPDYWQTHVDSRVEDVRRAMENAGWSKSAFLFYTDLHGLSSFPWAVIPKMLKYLHEHTPINKTMYGGDIVNTESTDTTQMKYLYDWRNGILDLPNHHSVVGNHDDGNQTNNLFDSKYVYAYLMAPEETPDIVRGGDMYYYIDEPSERTRYLYLDTAYKTILYDVPQTRFMLDSLKSTPDGWHIVVVAHIWYVPTADYDYNSTLTSANIEKNWSAKMILPIFDKYNSRESGSVGVQVSSTDHTETTLTYDFSTCGGRVEFCIGGHLHIDYDGKSDGGIPVILCEAAGTGSRGKPGYQPNSTNEAAVSAIVADYDALKVSVIRVGRGNSRTVTLKAAFTNQLPISTDATGAIYNGTGYKENTRINSSNAETAATGWDVTGFIPAKKGDIIRVKNLTFMDLDGSGGEYSRTTINAYDSNKAKLHQETPAVDGDWETAFHAVLEGGNIVQFTVPSWFPDGIAYIRLCVRDINANSIITVNEVIT